MQLTEREYVQTSSCIHFSLYISRQKKSMSYGFFTFWKELIYYLHKSGGVPGHSVQIKTCKNDLQYFL